MENRMYTKRNKYVQKLIVSEGDGEVKVIIDARR